LLTRDRDPPGQEAFTCHPVVRDHFRTLLLARDPASATTAAGLLTGQAGGQAQDLEELQVVTIAIGLLLDADQLTEAYNLYRERLANGRVVDDLVAPREAGVRAGVCRHPRPPRPPRAGPLPQRLGFI
jgi:hypothetical protein